MGVELDVDDAKKAEDALIDKAAEMKTKGWDDIASEHMDIAQKIREQVTD